MNYFIKFLNLNTMSKLVSKVNLGKNKTKELVDYEIDMRRIIKNETFNQINKK